MGGFFGVAPAGFAGVPGFVQVDDANDLTWDVKKGDTWHWDPIGDRGGSKLAVFNLSTGVHTIKVKAREDGTKLDQMLLTNDLDFVPSGIGG